MALTNPDYSGFKTLSQYANQLAFLKKQYAEGNTAWATAEAAKLRWQATLNRIDLKSLETQAMIKSGGDPNAIDWVEFEKNTAAPLTTAATLGFYLKALDENTMSHAEAEQLAQQIRVNAAYTGLDMRLLEERAEQYSDPNHKEASTNTINSAMASYIAEAKYAAELLKNADRWKAIDTDPNMTAGQKTWYKNQVHNNSQELRAKALREGLNLWAIEKLYMPLSTGRAWTNADYEAARAYIDPLYKAEGKNPSGIPVPERSSGGTMKDFAYKMPTVHKTMYGETYSGADMVVFFAFPGYKPVEIGVATTVSVTTYREKKQIRTIGRITARGITRGPRTVSGKLIFTVIHEHIIETLKATIPYLSEYNTLKFDELPSFDIMVAMGNEYGGSATLVINGVTTVDEQKTLSVEELFTENIFTYLARDYQPLRSVQKSTKENYDPHEWFSYKFREKGSELIGRFSIDQLALSENAKNFASALPMLGASDAWEGMSANDIMQAYYQNFGNDQTRAEQAKAEAAAAEKTVNSREIFVQVFSNLTNQPLSAGKITVTFNQNAYDEVSGGSETGSMLGYERGDDYDWSLATPSAANPNTFYGLYVVPDNVPPAGLGFTVTYSGYVGFNGRSTFLPKTMTASLVEGKYTYVKVIATEENDNTLYLRHKNDDTLNLFSYYESYRRIDHMPTLTELTLSNYKELVDKSYDGNEWLACETMRGPNMASMIAIKISWEIIVPSFASATTKVIMAKFDSKAYKSTVALKTFENLDVKTVYTDTQGQYSVRLKDLVYFKGAKGEKLLWADLPEGVFVKVYASIVNTQYIQWMARKIATPNAT